MLALIFSRAANRRPVGLLALGEWSPATGAITGTVTTRQAGQQDLASGAVVEPVVTVVSGGGGGGGGWVSLRRPGEWRPARAAISGSVTTQQAGQQSLAVGGVVNPVQVPVIMLVRTLERQEIKIVGDHIDDDELAAVAALLMEAG